MLKPSAYFPNLLQNASTIRRGFLPHTSGHGTTAWVDVGDIAACASTVLGDDGHLGASYYITGAEALSYPQLALCFASVLARPIRAVFLPAPTYRVVLRRAGSTCGGCSSCESGTTSRTVAPLLVSDVLQVEVESLGQQVRGVATGLTGLAWAVGRWSLE